MANRGYSVAGVDIVEKTVEIINKGQVHIIEPELDIFVRAAVNSKKLEAFLGPQKSDIYIIAVPTPFDDEQKPNTSHVFAAVSSIIPLLKKGDLIILESTSPIGTTKKINNFILEQRDDLLSPQKKSHFHIAYCPERVLPGHIMKELVENDRIVGGLTEESTQEAVSFYKTFVEGEVLSTNARTAEMAKLTENSYRDSGIAFANELSIICEKLEVNVSELINLANHHPRVNILTPGPGVGGHCIAVDPWFLIHAGGKEAKMIKVAREVNNYKTEWVIEKIKNIAFEYEKNNQKQPQIACMGLAFKADIDDLRESPSLHIAKELISTTNYEILLVEPNITNHKELKIIEYEKALEIADIVVFLVPHKEFKNLNIKNSLDFCGITNK